QGQPAPRPAHALPPLGGEKDRPAGPQGPPPPPIPDPTPPPGPPLTRKPARPDTAEDALRRELYLFALYRTLEASLLALVVFSPFGGLIGELRDPFLAMAVAIAYLPMSLALLLATRRDHSALAWPACLGVGADIAFAALITHAIPGAAPGVAMMLLFNVGAAALLVPLPLAMSVAAAAASAVVGEYLWNTLDGSPAERPFAEVLMFSVSFFAMATVSNLLGRQMRESHAVASLRAAEVANLNEVNGLIIRRMRTGVLLVDRSDFVRLANEAALMLLGDIDLVVDGKPRNVRDFAPELATRLAAWRKDDITSDIPILIDSDGHADDQIEVLPR